MSEKEDKNQNLEEKEKENKEEEVEKTEENEETKQQEEKEEENNKKEEEEEEKSDQHEEEEEEQKEFIPKIPDLEETEPRNFDDDPSIMTLKNLPTWAEEGPELIKNNPPTKFEAKYKPNTEINEKVSFWMRGNSAKLACDAVVNAANSYLLPGGGICGVLHSASGPEMAVDCHKIGHTPTGRCAITKGYKLPAKYCIHTVGPIGEQPDKLTEAYENTLKCIDGEKIRSIGFCCISTGIYGYPIKPATRIAFDVVRKFLEVPENREKTDRIVFVVFERKDVVVYNQMRHEYFPLDVEYTFAEEEEEKPEKEGKSNKVVEEEEEEYYEEEEIEENEEEQEYEAAEGEGKENNAEEEKQESKENKEVVESQEEIKENLEEEKEDDKESKELKEEDSKEEIKESPKKEE